MPTGCWVTLSAGIAELADAAADGELYRLADRALYWSKANGRDRAWLYDAEVVRELTAEERDANLERGQALMGVKALARAIDAKDPATSQHSERVARIAVRLAGELGWPAERIALLREAALVHDVGKLGVSDQILLKPALLTAEEQEAMRTHAALGAEIAGEVLDARAGRLGPPSSRAPRRPRLSRRPHRRGDPAGRRADRPGRLARRHGLRPSLQPPEVLARGDRRVRGARRPPVRPRRRPRPARARRVGHDRLAVVRRRPGIGSNVGPTPSGGGKTDVRPDRQRLGGHQAGAARRALDGGPPARDVLRRVDRDRHQRRAAAHLPEHVAVGLVVAVVAPDPAQRRRPGRARRAQRGRRARPGSRE